MSAQGHKYTECELADGFYKQLYYMLDGKQLHEAQESAKKRYDDITHKEAYASLVYRLGSKKKADEECEFIRQRFMDPCEVKYKNFTCMIDTIFEYMDWMHMKPEYFQMELLRGCILGMAEYQFGNDLFKYKHLLLQKFGLATPEIWTYNPKAPSLAVAKQIDDVFEIYARNYTCAMAPRQCGKSTIVVLIIMGMVLFMDITIAVQAHVQHQSMTLCAAIESHIYRVQSLPWYSGPKVSKGSGPAENREYIFESCEKTVTVHYLSGGANVSTSRNGRATETIRRFTRPALSRSGLCQVCAPPD